MTRVLSSFFRAVRQFGDPVFRQIVLISIVAAVAVLWGFALVLSWGLAVFLSDGITLPWIGTILAEPLSIGWSSFFIAIGLSVFLMVPVASAVSSMFLDRVAQAVENRHYPNLPAVSPQPMTEALRDTIGFLGILIAANLVAVFLYLFFSPFAPIIFWGLNGYLLGREYFQMAATRRIGRMAARDLWRANRITIWSAGILMAVPLSVPIVNLIVPVLGAATFTHLYHSLPKGPSDYRNPNPVQ